MINLTAHLNLIKFSEIANGLPREDAERVATAFPDMFKDAIEFGPAKEPTPKGEPAGPRVAKVRPAKANVSIDKDAVKVAALDDIRRNPASKAEDVTARLFNPATDGDRETFGKTVKWALEAMVDDTLLSCEGARRGRKYTVMTPRAVPQEAAE
jgi:hypothetical protein